MEIKEKDVMSFGLLFLFIGLVSGGVIILDVGTTTFNSNIEVNGNLTNVQDIIPTADVTYDIGNTTYRWNKIYSKYFESRFNSTLMARIYTDGSYAYLDKSTKLGWLVDVDSGGEKWNSFILIQDAAPSNKLFFTVSDTQAKITTSGVNLTFNIPQGYIYPVADNTLYLGSYAHAWKNVTAYDFTTKSSREVILNPGNAVDQIKGIRTLPDGKLDHSSIPESYKTGDFWQVNETIYPTLNDVPPEDRGRAEHHATISMNGRMDLLEAAVRELAAENELLKEELCIFDLGYEFCR